MRQQRQCTEKRGMRAKQTATLAPTSGTGSDLSFASPRAERLKTNSSGYKRRSRTTLITTGSRCIYRSSKPIIIYRQAVEEIHFNMQPLRTASLLFALTLFVAVNSRGGRVYRPGDAEEDKKYVTDPSAKVEGEIARWPMDFTSEPTARSTHRRSCFHVACVPRVRVRTCTVCIDSDMHSIQVKYANGILICRHIQEGRRHDFHHEQRPSRRRLRKWS